MNCWIAWAPPAMTMSLSAAVCRACSSAVPTPAVTKLKVVPPCIGSGSRAWWVRINTGTRYRGGAPHPPVPPLSPHPPPPRPRLRPGPGAPGKHLPPHDVGARIPDGLGDDLRIGGPFAARHSVL